MGHGQCARIAQLVGALAHRSELTVYYLQRSSTIASLPSPPLPFSIMAFESDQPLQMALFFKEIEALEAEIAIVEYLHLSWIVDHLPKGVHTLLDTHDLAHRRSAVYREEGIPLGVQWEESEERALFAKFDQVMMIQEEEAEIARGWLGEERCIICSHPMPLVEGYEVARDGKRIRVIASPSEANVRGVLWLHEEVLPHLRQDVVISVHGSICLGGELRQRCPGLEWGGVIDDLAHFYHQSDLMINPVLFGTGLKIKSVEALSHGVPLLSTSAGAMGLKKEGAFVVCDDPKEFAQNIHQLCGSSALRAELSKKAYQYAARYFTLEECFAPIFQLL